MSKIIYTFEQQVALAANEHVRRCSERSITYTKAFKRKAVQQYEAGQSSRDIFTQAGFDLRVIGEDKPTECLKRWRQTVRRKGEAGLSESRGRGRPKTTHMSDKEKINYLEAKVAYLKEENDFLAKLRAKRRTE